MTRIFQNFFRNWRKMPKTTFLRIFRKILFKKLQLIVKIPEVYIREEHNLIKVTKGQQKQEIKKVKKKGETMKRKTV